MEYLYIAMLLQEYGKEINATNIHKILESMNKEAENEKIQLFLLVLSVILSEKDENIDKKVEREYERGEKQEFEKREITNEQFITLQKRFDRMEDTIKTMNEKLQEIVWTEKPIQREEAVPIQEAVVIEEKELYDMEEQSLKVIHEQPGRYVYGIAGKGIRETLGNIGLDRAEVYTIPYKDACIVVHDCQAKPYKSEDENVVKEWLFKQQEVLDIAADKFDSVLPMSFDMIIEGKNGSDPEEEAIKWLETNYESFMVTLSKIKNRQEYGIQVILNTGELSENIFEIDEKLKKKKEEIDAKPEGIAYMEREMLKDLIKERIEEKADQYFKEFYAMIKKYTDDIVIGKVKKVGGNQQMLMNLSCLVNKNQVAPLGEELEKIENHEAITVRFSGPWAPYSFVTPEKGVTNNAYR